MKFWILLVAILLVVVLAFILLPKFTLGLTFVLLIAAVVIGWQGWRKIPNVPPHIGVRTWFGERQNEVVKEGWHFFLLYPFVQGFVPVNVQKERTRHGPY